MNFLDNFSVDRFLFSLQYMWQGMLSIFIVIGIIISSVVLLNKLTNRKKSGDKAKKTESN